MVLQLSESSENHQEHGGLLEARLVEMKAALVERGVAVTPKRAKLLEVLLASDQHPSASEIHEGVKVSYPGTSLATIYNTIEILKEAGQVLEIEFSGSSNRYDGRIPDSHPHLVCLQCEKVEDITGEVIDFPHHSPLDSVAQATGYSLVRLRTDYYGTCPECLSESSPVSGGRGCL